MLSPFSALNKALNVKNELSVIVQICNLKFTIRYDSYYNLYAMHYNSSKNLLNKNELMIVLLTLNIMSINIGKKLIYLKCVNVILRCYRKYKLRTARIRNDFVICGLTEYFFHPSRVSFEI